MVPERFNVNDGEFDYDISSMDINECSPIAANHKLSDIAVQLPPVYKGDKFTVKKPQKDPNSRIIV